MRDPLLDRLTEDLRPVTPMLTRRLWLGAVAGLAVAVVYIWLLYHPRPEIVSLLRGQWAGNAMPVLKPLLFVVFGLCGLAIVADLSRPEGRLDPRRLLPVAVIAAVTLLGLVYEGVVFGVRDYAAWLSGGVLTCYLTILCGGMAGLIVMWRFWLRRAATSQPRLLGAMSGFAAASLMAAAYALHCQGDAPVYLLLVYGGAVAIFTGIAAWLGGRLLRW